MLKIRGRLLCIYADTVTIWLFYRHNYAFRPLWTRTYCTHCIMACRFNYSARLLLNDENHIWNFFFFYFGLELRIYGPFHRTQYYIIYNFIRIRILSRKISQLNVEISLEVRLHTLLYLPLLSKNKTRTRNLLCTWICRQHKTHDSYLYRLMRILFGTAAVFKRD